MKKGMGFVIVGLILAILAYPFTSFVYSQDAVLVRHVPLLSLMGACIGVGVIAAGIIKLKLGIRKKKINSAIKAILLITLIIYLFTFSNYVNPGIPIASLIINLGLSITALKDRTKGFVIFSFVFSFSMLLAFALYPFLPNFWTSAPH